MDRDACAFVLAAGLGTRLRPLTDVCAKALVPIGDRPAIAHVVDALRAAGVARVAVNAFHRADEVRAFAERSGLVCSVEEVLLGTAGGIHRARALLGGSALVVWNGDIFAPSFDVAGLLAAHASGGGSATLAVRPTSAGQGTVGIAKDGAVVRLRNERFGEEATGGEFMGVHVIGADVRVPERGCIVGDVYIPMLNAGARLVARAFDGVFIDIGTPASYVAASAAWLSARGLRSFTAEDAVVAPGVDIAGSVIGARARVAASARASVVWPDARVDHPLVRAIVGPFGVVTL